MKAKTVNEATLSLGIPVGTLYAWVVSATNFFGNGTIMTNEKINLVRKPFNWS